MSNVFGIESQELVFAHAQHIPHVYWKCTFIYEGETMVCFMQA